MKQFIDYKNFRIKIIKIIQYKDNIKVLEVKITDRKKGIIGHGSFSWNTKTNQIFPGDVFINEEYQRKGIGNQMYQYVEKFTSSIMHPSHRQSADAKKFWNQPYRPFGNKNS